MGAGAGFHEALGALPGTLSGAFPAGRVLAASLPPETIPALSAAVSDGPLMTGSDGCEWPALGTSPQAATPARGRLVAPSAGPSPSPAHRDKRLRVGYGAEQDTDNEGEAWGRGGGAG